MSSRRKSIAVTSTGNDDPTMKRKRRAHSIAPGEYISPSKARRPIGPRKSILKPANQPIDDDDDETASGSGSQESTRTLAPGPRPSLAAARRVSFAQHSYVREYYKDQNKSSPTSSQPPPVDNGVTDENAYPGGGKRRSSMRKSIAFSEAGEESMEMEMDETAPMPAALRFSGELNDDDDELDEDGEGDDDEMDITEDLSAEILARRSLSLGPASTPRRPFAPVAGSSHIPIPPTPPHRGRSSDPDYSQDFDDEEQSYISELTTTSAGSNTSTGPLEYTIPLVKPAAPMTDAWHALRSVTHSGNEPLSDPPLSDDYDGVLGGGEMDMELTNALDRLRAAALPSGPMEEQEHDSFASTEDSFDDDGDGQGVDMGDHTLNHTEHRRMSMAAGSEGEVSMAMTNIVGRRSIAPFEPYEDEEESMAMTNVFRRQSVAHSEGEEDMAMTKVVFSAPPVAPAPVSPAPAPVSLTIPEPFNFTFTPAPLKSVAKLPAKAAPKSPAKGATKIPTPAFSVFSAPARSPAPASPRKRPFEAHDEEAAKRPSPAKKVALASPSKSKPTASPSKSKKEVPIASPSKQPVPKPTTAGRRPSGYFAQRKSLGGAGLSAGMSGLRARMSVGGLAKGAGINVQAEKARAQSEREEEQAREEEEEEMSVPPSVVHEADMENQLDPTDAIETVSVNPAVDDPTDAIETVSVNPAVEWRDAQGESEYAPEDSTPAISIEQFLSMTGIRFMDEIVAPRRQSMAHPARRASSSDAEADLAAYVVAMAIDVPQLELYTYVARDLDAWIVRSRDIFAEAEVEAARDTPELFREFIGAPEDGQAELLHQLKLIKANTQASARAEWYDWKLQWVEQLFGKADKAFADLTADAEALEKINGQAQILVPQLRDEYEQVMRELEAEKACVAEIESCDQKYLSELKAEIAVQDAQLEAFQGEVDDGNTKLGRLQEKLDELAGEKQEATAAVERAERLIHIQKNSTNAEVFRLKDELESLQNLHLWHAVKIQPDLLELIYASTYRVSIPCKKFVPDVEGVDIQRLEKVSSKIKDAFPPLTDLMLRMAKQVILRDKGIITTRQIIQRLSDYWSSCTQLRGQLRLLAVKYPLDITVLPSENGVSGFKATATIVIRSLKAKALISFVLDFPTFASWPMSLHATGCEVEVIYGPIQKDPIHNAVVGRLQQASPTENHACLLDACLEALDSCS